MGRSGFRPSDNISSAVSIDKLRCHGNSQIAPYPLTFDTIDDRFLEITGQTHGRILDRLFTAFAKWTSRCIESDIAGFGAVL